MKSKFGTALALVAVLLTGTAAAVINTQALVAPTGSTLGTGSTTLLPADQAVTSVSGQIQVSQDLPAQTSTASNQVANQVATSQLTQQDLNTIQTIVTPVTNQTSAAVTNTQTSPTVVYGNPNPSNGDVDDEDEDDEDDEDEDDEEDDD